MKWGAMKAHRRRRLTLIALDLLAVGSTIGLTLRALNSNINLFYAPDQIVGGEAPINQRIRAGGMVAEGSLVREAEGLMVRFEVTDRAGSVFEMGYEGILPDLFREGQGIVATGYLREDGRFMAEEVLAKHDEKYMPPELAGMSESVKEMPYRVD